MWPLRYRRGDERPQAKAKVIPGPWRPRPQWDPAVTELMERYQSADEHDRLHLWLQHRDLRTVLDNLDQVFHRG